MQNYILLILGLIITSCRPQPVQQQQDHVSNPINVDSLSVLFLAGWNAQDSVAIMNSIADDAVVMNDSLVHTGTKAIAERWVSGGVRVLSNIRTISSIREANESIAYDGGTYSLDLTPPGGPTLKERGNYSLVWTRQQSGEWKLTLIHIEDVTRLPDIQ